MGTLKRLKMTVLLLVQKYSRALSCAWGGHTWVEHEGLTFQCLTCRETFTFQKGRA